MPGMLLTVASTVQCPHGGSVRLATKNARVRAGGALALLETDVHPVVGCAFTVGLKYSPCVRVEWSAGAQAVTAQAAVLVRSSVGKCLNAEGAPQGVALVGGTQGRARAR
jgi:hypothetical protein